MAKKKREKSLAEYDVEGGPVHRARKKQPHVAQEYYENGDQGSAQSLVRNLRERHQRAVLPGLQEKYQ